MANETSDFWARADGSRAQVRKQRTDSAAPKWVVEESDSGQARLLLQAPVALAARTGDW